MIRRIPQFCIQGIRLAFALLLSSLLLHLSSAVVSLPFGDINVVVLTDVHSWVGGHGVKEPHLNADYGDVLSFYERLKEHCETHNHDLWFVVNGDWIDGTGLATNGDPSNLIPLLEKMPWDALNIGNHELYREEVINYMTRPGGFVNWWGSRYLSSNIVHTDTMKPIGNRYRLLKGKNSIVMTFGFLYNMKTNSPVVTVEEVESVMQETWFGQALQEDFDAIMVLAHMDVKDNLVRVILERIRDELGNDMPIQFVTGHTHYRGIHRPDNTSSSFEAGRYLDTVGFVSFPKRSTIKSMGGNRTDLFEHKYLDANTELFKDILDIPTLETENGKELSDFITKTQEEMGLDEIVGCIKQSYYVNRSLEEDDSLWKLFRDHVVPTNFDGNKVCFMGDGSWRYDLLEGEVVLDEVIGVSPYNHSLYLWKGIPGDILVELNSTMNEKPESFYPLLPMWVLAPAVKPFKSEGNNFDLVIREFELGSIQPQVVNIFPDAMEKPPIQMNMTSTSIWLDFFRKTELCQTSNTGKKQGHKKKKTTPAVPKEPRPGHSNQTPTQDTLRLAFVGVAVAVVLVLGAVNVWQRGSRWREEVEARDQATTDALREYEGEEGEFV